MLWIQSEITLSLIAGGQQRVRSAMGPRRALVLQPRDGKDRTKHDSPTILTLSAVISQDRRIVQRESENG